MSMIEKFMEKVGRCQGVRWCSEIDGNTVMHLFEPTDIVYYRDENFIALDGDCISIELCDEDFLSDARDIFFTTQGMFAVLDFSDTEKM